MQTAIPLTKPTKQRKMFHQAPDHVRHRLLAAHLSQELRATHVAKSIPVRSGDTIRVMRGDHKGFEGKITRIDLKNYRIYIEGLTREKVDGTTVFVAVHPSKLMITRLNLDDKWRKKILERKQKPKKKPQKQAKKPKPEPAEKTLETAELKQPPTEKVAEGKVAEKKIAEEKVTEEKVTAAIEIPLKKKVSKPVAKPRKKTKATAEKKKAQAEETKIEKEPKTQRKRSKGKKAKKTDEGEG